MLESNCSIDESGPFLPIPPNVRMTSCSPHGLLSSVLGLFQRIAAFSGEDLNCFLNVVLTVFLAEFAE